MKIVASLLAPFVLLVLAAAAAHAECAISQASGVNIEATTAHFSMELKGCAKPTQAWFEWGTRPDLADATRVEAALFIENWTGPQLRGLAPESTYYFRPYARFADGAVVAGKTASLKTQRDAQAFAECRYDGQDYRQYAGTDPRYVGRDGIALNLQCNRLALGGVLRLKLSPNADMAGARVQTAETLPERSEYNFFRHGFFLSFDEFPDGTILYVEAELEKNGIVTRDKIVKAVLKRTEMDAAARRTLLRRIPEAVELLRLTPPVSYERRLADDLLTDLCASIRPREFDQPAIDKLIDLLDDRFTRYTAMTCLSPLINEPKARKMGPKLLAALADEECAEKPCVRTGPQIEEDIRGFLSAMNIPFKKANCSPKCIER